MFSRASLLLIRGQKNYGHLVHTYFSDISQEKSIHVFKIVYSSVRELILGPGTSSTFSVQKIMGRIFWLRKKCPFYPSQFWHICTLSVTKVTIHVLWAKHTYRTWCLIMKLIKSFQPMPPPPPSTKPKKDIYVATFPYEGGFLNAILKFTRFKCNGEKSVNIQISPFLN